ncbi:MAG: response regulator transcription factor [Elusimicrobiota bacterium]
MKGAILIVDDDRMMSDLIGSILKDEGYKTFSVAGADAALAWLKSKQADLMILDVAMPGINGFQFLSIIRKDAQLARLPVIMVTSKGEESNKVRGLEGGADDYLVKPFSHKELAARVAALLRRTSAGPSPEQAALEAEGIRLDLSQHEAWARGRRIHLTATEFSILAELIRRRGVLLTHANMGEIMGEGGRDITSETLYVHINTLRKKLGDDGRWIETVRGLGYKFSPSSL